MSKNSRNKVVTKPEVQILEQLKKNIVTRLNSNSDKKLKKTKILTKLNITNGAKTQISTKFKN